MSVLSSAYAAQADRAYRTRLMQQSGKGAAVADMLERLAGDMHSAAFDWREPAMSHAEVDDRIEEVERILAAARAAVRGRP